jgi:ribosomal protein L24E
MYIDDPDWEGPRCRFCGAPIKDPKKAVKIDNLEVYFCDAACVRAKYIG